MIDLDKIDECSGEATAKLADGLKICRSVVDSYRLMLAERHAPLGGFALGSPIAVLRKGGGRRIAASDDRRDDWEGDWDGGSTQVA